MTPRCSEGPETIPEKPAVHGQENARRDHPAFAVSHVAKPVVDEEDGSCGERGDHQRPKGQDGRLSYLMPNTREVLPRNTVEELDILEIARHEMEREAAGRGLVIEGDAIIAMDLRSIVTSMGHDVTGIGRSRQGAMRICVRVRRDLLLADVQLAHNSSGIDAVNKLLAEAGELPTVFITAFPDHLRTGDRPEPAIFIAKPCAEEKTRSAVSLAMFFASPGTRKAS
jgi:CheY-like chemotaxis protein